MRFAGVVVINLIALGLVAALGVGGWQLAALGLLLFTAFVWPQRDVDRDEPRSSDP